MSLDFTYICGIKVLHLLDKPNQRETSGGIFSITQQINKFHNGEKVRTPR